MPKIGKEVETPEGFGTVIDLNVLKETVTVRIRKGEQLRAEDLAGYRNQLVPSAPARFAKAAERGRETTAPATPQG